MTSPPQVFTKAEAAAALGVEYVTITRWTADGTLTAFREAPFMYQGSEIARKAGEMAADLRAKLAILEDTLAGLAEKTAVAS